MIPIPLRLFLLAHPHSDSANLLAQELMRRFVDPPASGGLRLPVFFTPDRGDGLPPAWEAEEGINLEASAHTLVVVLADARMALKTSFAPGEPATGTAWTAFLDEGARRAPVGTSPHHVFAVAIAKARNDKDCNDANVFALGGPRHVLGVTKEPERLKDEPSDDYLKRCQSSWAQLAADEVALHISIRTIRLLAEDKVPADVSFEQKAPVRLFFSHAKADLKSDESDVVRRVEDAIQELPIEPWFDAAKIRPGQSFASEISAGLQDSTIVVAFLTDHYASRPWCQREILEAKQLGAPILVVDALQSGEPRNFPYLGNLPTIHWTTPAPNSPSVPSSMAATADASANSPKAEARRIVIRAVREALRFRHNRAVLERWKDAGETVVASAPEALLLAWHGVSDGGVKLLYPDPPLTKPELAVLTQLRSKDLSLTTPLTKLAEWRHSAKPPGLKCIAVSTSVSHDKRRWGLTAQHEESIFDELHGYLLMAGLQIAYGGALKIEQGSNFTLRLFELVRSYSTLADDAGAGPLKPIVNYAPWPLRLTYGNAEAALFGDPSDPNDRSVAHLVQPDEPPESEVPRHDEQGELFPRDANLFTLPDTTARRLGWTRGLTRMRQQMTNETQARIVIGGKLFGFSGLYPGVVEEAWMSIVVKKPLYLVGAFGGAARAVIDLLQGRDRPEVHHPVVADPKSKLQPPTVESILQLAEERKLTVVKKDTPFDSLQDLSGKLIDPARMADDIQAAGQKGLGTALHNGLTDEENKELFRSTDPPWIAELILTGLAKLDHSAIR
jgi:hypothetical protein